MEGTQCRLHATVTRVKIGLHSIFGARQVMVIGHCIVALLLYCVLYAGAIIYVSPV